MKHHSKQARMLIPKKRNQRLCFNVIDNYKNDTKRYKDVASNAV